MPLDHRRGTRLIAAVEVRRGRGAEAGTSLRTGSLVLSAAVAAMVVSMLPSLGFGRSFAAGRRVEQSSVSVDRVASDVADSAVTAVTAL